jgi:C-terminal processing protease CtpA/Prc
VFSLRIGGWSSIRHAAVVQKSSRIRTPESGTSAITSTRTAGLQPDNVVAAIDGTPVESAAEASELAQGTIGTPVTLTIRRGGTELSSAMVRVDLDALIARTK